MLNKGAVLYRDFWDLKQPGIYWFYLIAGRTYGFTEVGIHSFELSYFIFFAAIIQLSMRTYFVRSSTMSLAVLFSIGAYLVVCGTWHLTQAEGLVAFPIFVCLWASCPDVNRNQPIARRCVIFGAAAIIVALFKLILIIVPIAFLINAMAIHLFKVRRSVKDVVLNTILPVLVGAVCALAPFIIYFWIKSQLGLLYETFVLYPPRIVSEVHLNGIRVLASSIKWFLLALLPLLPFAIIGAARRLIRCWDHFTVGLVCWIILGGLSILAQRMWWAYHFVLLIVPVGLLAATGFQEVQEWLARRSPGSALRRSLRTCLLSIIVLCPYAGRWFHKVMVEARDGLPNTLARQATFRRQISPAYASAAEEVKAISDVAPAIADVYVLGDPLIYYLLGKGQAVPLNGWSPEWFLHEQWVELAQQLESKRPQYIFVDNANRTILSEKGQDITVVLSKHYRKLLESEVGEWYVLRPSEK